MECSQKCHCVLEWMVSMDMNEIGCASRVTDLSNLNDAFDHFFFFVSLFTLWLMFLIKILFNVKCQYSDCLWINCTLFSFWIIFSRFSFHLYRHFQFMSVKLIGDYFVPNHCLLKNVENTFFLYSPIFVNIQSIEYINSSVWVCWLFNSFISFNSSTINPTGILFNAEAILLWFNKRIDAILWLAQIPIDDKSRFHSVCLLPFFRWWFWSICHSLKQPILNNKSKYKISDIFKLISCYQQTVSRWLDIDEFV